MAESGAIFGGAGADLRLLKALQMKILSHIANRRQGCRLGAVLGVKKEIPVQYLMSCYGAKVFSLKYHCI